MNDDKTAEDAQDFAAIAKYNGDVSVNAENVGDSYRTARGILDFVVITASAFLNNNSHYCSFNFF